MHFDWSTLVLQTVNVLVLLWLLRRFLFRPVMAIIAERKNAAEKLLTDAAAAREQAKAQTEQAALREKALAADGDRIISDARSVAAAERSALLQQATDEAAHLRATAQDAIEQQRGQFRQDLEAQARTLAFTIASRLLGRLPAQALSAALLESLDALSQQEWRGLAEPGETLEVVTAAPLDTPAQAACIEMIQQHAGCSVHSGIDASLIAGVELRGPHATLHNNWRADLNRIAEDLTQDDKHVVMA